MPTRPAVPTARTRNHPPPTCVQRESIFSLPSRHSGSQGLRLEPQRLRLQEKRPSSHSASKSLSAVFRPEQHERWTPKASRDPIVSPCSRKSIGRTSHQVKTRSATLHLSARPK